jgi:FAD/FMN-containing dehydrogenase
VTAPDVDDEGTLDLAVQAFADDVGDTGPVTISGSGTRGGAVVGMRTVSAPVGIAWIEPAEMTMRCGAGTPLADVAAALAAHGQCVAIPGAGTVGGALAVGHSGIRRLGWGPMRDALLQVRYVSAAGEVVKAGGPTVKNVSGFDLCRLMVGSHGTLGFFADVILRTRPLPKHEAWFTSELDPWALLAGLYRPTSVLWNGHTTWVLLDGHPTDIQAQASKFGLVAAAGPPELPAFRWSLPPDSLGVLVDDASADGIDGAASFVAEIGVGVVHHERAAPPRQLAPAVAEVAARVKAEFDPTHRLNPGRAPGLRG